MENQCGSNSPFFGLSSIAFIAAILLNRPLSQSSYAFIPYAIDLMACSVQCLLNKNKAIALSAHEKDISELLVDTQNAIARFERKLDHTRFSPLPKEERGGFPDVF